MLHETVSARPGEDTKRSVRKTRGGSGIPLAVVREMAGHASLATTDKYVRLARNELSAAAAAINAYAAPYMSPYTDVDGE